MATRSEGDPVPVSVPAPVRHGQQAFTLPSRPGIKMYMWCNAPPVGINVEARYLPLYQAALKGDWKRAKMFISDDSMAVRARISIFSMTALHVAAGQKHWHFVKHLLNRMDPEDLEMQDVGGNTALHYAAKAGCLHAVKAIRTKNPRLVQIPNKSGHLPLHIAASSSTSPEQKEVVWYLAIFTRDELPHLSFGRPRGRELISHLAASEYYDILINLYPNIATTCPDAGQILCMLTSGAFSFPSQSRLGFWERLVYPFVLIKPNNALPPTVMSDIDGGMHSSDIETATTTCLSIFSRLSIVQQRYGRWHIAFQVPFFERLYEEKVKHIYAMQFLKKVCETASQLNNFEVLQLFLNNDILSNAVARGSVEILTTCLEFFPDLVCFTANGETLLQTSIKHCQEKIFNLMQDMTAQNKWMASHIADGGNNTLHFAARLAPPIKLKFVSGAALQMQREIQWFKAVENLVHPTYKDLRNKDNLTAQELFSKEHKELLESGEKWMKNTAKSCMLVAALIATVVFAAAFTVPGGINDSDGIPIFSKKASFTIFIVSDALAFFSSTMSILMFLSILIARYTEEDFLMSLPSTLIIGLAYLFLAIATMMTSFGAALSFVLNHQVKKMSLVVIPLVYIPAGLFAILQVPLFVQMVISTHWSDIPWQKKGNCYRWLFGYRSLFTIDDSLFKRWMQNLRCGFLRIVLSFTSGGVAARSRMDSLC